MVERYWPGVTPQMLKEALDRAVTAAEVLSTEGHTVRYLGSTFIPSDECSFCLYRASSVAAVEEANHRAGASFDRVIEAVVLQAEGPTGSRNRPVGDRELVEAVRSGDVAAFSELYRAHCRAVHIVARSYARDAEAAADVVQEAFVRALERLPTLRQSERFRPWLLAIARHVAIDRGRAQGRVRGLDDHGGDEVASPDRGPAQEAELAELVKLVEGCVGGLGPRDATAVAMVTHLGYSPAEVGAVLGVSPGAAKVIVHRARRRLRHALTLQLLARHRAGACAVLVERWELDDVVGAARHVRTCQECVGAAGRELGLYDLVG